MPKLPHISCRDLLLVCMRGPLHWALIYKAELATHKAGDVVPVCPSHTPQHAKRKGKVRCPKSLLVFGECRSFRRASPYLKNTMILSDVVNLFSCTDDNGPQDLRNQTWWALETARTGQDLGARVSTSMENWTQGQPGLPAVEGRGKTRPVMMGIRSRDRETEDHSPQTETKEQEATRPKQPESQ